MPLNERLAGMDMSGPDARDWWATVYGPRWTRLNTVRTVACLAAAWLLLGALAQTGQ
ncbi:DUF1772 domain-containing protein [uncultured Jannaschia sp.]|uniref:DUF1772 domain-containing protein n=1 Tax=uncultured Jannaschia sp. TaxID=293347 RepID=UPI00262F534A|nr:DUF1772 domain-containing protein [uncultured Jannaschia sp.]